LEREDSRGNIHDIIDRKRRRMTRWYIIYIAFS